MNDRDRRFTGWAFTTMFVLAFIYMGALSAALEGWTRTFTVLSWAGMTIMVAAAIACIITMFTTRGE
jgi:hypothetical protein